MTRPARGVLPSWAAPPTPARQRPALDHGRKVTGALIASNARNAELAGVCLIGEPHSIRAGERVADLPDGTTAHTVCAARAGA